MPAAKRKRTDGGSASPQAVAAAINARINKKYPYSDYGRMYNRRGTIDSLAMFGPSYKEADEEQRLARRKWGYVGRGKYWGQALGSALGGIGGMFLGGPKGAAIGSKLGGHFGDKWTGKGVYTGRKYSGKGQYTPSNTNELIAGSDEKAPVIQSAGDETGALRITHREYIGDIFAPPTATVSDFTVQSFPLNPGLEQTFPWLSQIAQNYEEYELEQCVFEFVSTVQDINSANGQVGTIITATQYNASRPDFTDKPAMAAYAHSVSGKSTDNQNHGVECDPNKLSGSEGKFVRANPVMTGEDLKTYDHGRFQLATHNIPSAMAGGTLGELYVYYTVKLRKPKFFTGRGLGVNRWLAVADASTQGAIARRTCFASDADRLYARQNNLPIVLTSVVIDATTGGHTLTFPAYFGGRLRITGIVEGNDLAGNILDGDADIIAGGNVTFVSDLYSAGDHQGDSPHYSVISNDGVARRMFMISINVAPVTNAVDNTLLLRTRLTAGTVNQSSLEITEYNTFGEEGAPTLVNLQGVPQQVGA